MNKAQKDSITRALVNAFMPIIVNRDINDQSLAVSHLKTEYLDGGLADITTRVTLEKAFTPVTGFSASQAKIVFDVVFYDCDYNPDGYCYEWTDTGHKIRLAESDKHIYWSSETGETLVGLDSDDEAEIATAFLTDLFASLKPRITKSFLVAVSEHCLCKL